VQPPVYARSANFFGSLPVRREGLFATHYLAGLAFLVVPNAAIFLLTLLIEAIGGTVLLPGLGFWLAVACGECFFFYSLAVFCGMFTGHILALPAFYAVINFLVIGVTELLSVVFRAFYHGFSGFADGVHEVVKWFTPVVRLEERVRALWHWVDEAAQVSGGERVLDLGCGSGILSVAALRLGADEVITEIKFEFGTVQAGFHQVEAPYILCQVNGDLPSEYRFTNKTDVGGQRGDEWVIAKDQWTTIIYAKPRGKLPKTGF